MPHNLLLMPLIHMSMIGVWMGDFGIYQRMCILLGGLWFRVHVDVAQECDNSESFHVHHNRLMQCLDQQSG